MCVCVCLPDDLDQLAHVDVVRYQELGLVQNRQLFLSLISLNDDLQQQRHTTNRKSVSGTEIIMKTCGHIFCHVQATCCVLSQQEGGVIISGCLVFTKASNEQNSSQY